MSHLARMSYLVPMSDRDQHIAFQTRTLDVAIRAARAGRYSNFGVSIETGTGALGIAFEHCLFAARRGLSPSATLHEIGIGTSRLTTWGDVIARLVAMWLEECWPELQDLPANITVGVGGRVRGAV